MGQTDRLLRQLIDRVEDTRQMLGITIFVGGATVTGTIAPRDGWLQFAAEHVYGPESDLKTIGAAFLSDADLDDDGFLHLVSAKVVFGSAIVPESGGLARIPLHAVNGWMIGSLTVAP